MSLTPVRACSVASAASLCSLPGSTTATTTAITGKMPVLHKDMAKMAMLRTTETKMDIREIKRLVELMVHNDLSELDISEGENKIHLKRGGAVVSAAPAAPVAAPASPVASKEVAENCEAAQGLS